MATNDFQSQFKLKRLSQSIWFNLIHVLLLLIVIVGLGFFFLLIVMNKKMYTMGFNLFPVTPHPQPPSSQFFSVDYTPGGDAAPLASAPLLPVVIKYCIELCLVCKLIGGKMNEQRTKFLLMHSGTLLKIKFTHSFLMTGSEGRQCKDCFSTTWHCTESCFLRSNFYHLVSV